MASINDGHDYLVDYVKGGQYVVVTHFYHGSTGVYETNVYEIGTKHIIEMEKAQRILLVEARLVHNQLIKNYRRKTIGLANVS